MLQLSILDCLGAVSSRPSSVKQENSPDSGTARLSPRTCPLPNPKLAAKFQKLADGMEKTVQAKLHPAIGNQNLTARRARITASIQREGQKLALVQNWLYQLAERHRDGTCPMKFAAITDRSHLTAFAVAHEWREEGSGYLHTCFERGWDNVALFAQLGITSPKEVHAALDELEALGTSPVARLDRSVQQAAELRRRAIFSKAPDFFPTPPKLIERMLDFADVQSHHRVLEPSAGGGDICLALRDRGVTQIDCYEWHSGLAEALTLLGFPPIAHDFLSSKPERIYDRIIMNPPFTKDIYIDHIYHAYEWLAPGGQLISIVPSGYDGSSKAKRKEFANWLTTIGVGDYPNPADAFTKNDRSCGVSTRMIHISS
jgi:methylase of polypeptide subunit release factors